MSRSKYNTVFQQVNDYSDFNMKSEFVIELNIITSPEAIDAC